MKASKKNYSILLFLFITSFIIVLIGTSFAFFTARVSGIIHHISIRSAEIGTVTAEGTTLNLYIASTDMKVANGSNNYTAYKEPTTPLTIKLDLASGSSAGIECTYDLVYKPFAVYYKSAANTLGLKELTIRGSQEVLSGSDTTATGSLPEFDLTGVATETTIVAGAKIIITGSNKTGTVEWKIYPRYYNLALNQDDNTNRSFGGNIDVVRLVCVNIYE